MLHYFSAPAYNVYFVFDLMLFIALIITIFKTTRQQHRVFFLACAAAIFANFYLDTIFYKLVISYRGQIRAAAYVNQKTFDNYHLYNLSAENNVFQFYSNRHVDYLPTENFKTITPQAQTVFFANQKAMDSLKNWHADYKVIKAFTDYHQETVDFGFINKNSRPKVLDSVYLISK